MVLGLMITEGNKQKRQSPMTLPFPFSSYIVIYFLKNFFLPYPASPSNPEPRRSIVAGSGTALIRYIALRNKTEKWKRFTQNSRKTSTKKRKTFPTYL
jgi:hypothetical protein